VEPVAVGGPGAWDEEDERQLWLQRLELSLLDALSQLDLLGQEAELLAHHCASLSGRGAGPAVPSDGHTSTSGRAQGERAGDAVSREAMRGKLSTIAAALAGAERERLRQQVGVEGVMLQDRGLLWVMAFACWLGWRAAWTWAWCSM